MHGSPDGAQAVEDGDVPVAHVVHVSRPAGALGRDLSPLRSPRAGQIRLDPALCKAGAGEGRAVVGDGVRGRARARAIEGAQIRSTHDALDLRMQAVAVGERGEARVELALRIST